MKKIFTLIAVLACALGMQAQDTWTVAGQKAILGVDWNTAETTNDMTTTDNVNYTLVKEGMMLKANTAGYEYKIVKNHAWDVAYPEQNATLPIEADGQYKITFSFNATTFEVSAVAAKTGEYVGPSEVVWIVAGSPDLLGVEWKGDATEGAENKMTSENGKIFTLVKTDVALNSETPYPYKYVKDESEWFGDAGEGKIASGNDYGNIILNVDAPGKYTVTFTLDSENMTASVTTVKTGEAEFGEKTWTVAGEEGLCGVNWDPANEANDMEEVDEGKFELTRYNVSLEAKTYEFKVVANHAWGEEYPSTNATLTITEAGVYDVTFSFIVSTKTVEAIAELSDGQGIQNVKTSANATAVIYNLQGQRVDAGYRGVAIQNGRKVVMK